MSWSKDSCLKIICEAYNRTFCSPIDGLINISTPDQELKKPVPYKISSSQDINSWTSLVLQFQYPRYTQYKYTCFDKA